MINLLKDRVAITPIFDSDMSSGKHGASIIIPDQAKSRCKQGIVKYVGSDVKELKPGDYVFFPGYTGSVFNLEDEGLLIIMRESSITALVESNQWKSVNVPGLYFMSHTGRDNFDTPEIEYFPATYEMAMTLISRAVTQNQALFNVKDIGTGMVEE